jgi:hypothetical protein
MAGSPVEPNSRDSEVVMPDLPLPSQTDVTIQNQTTGQVDYLKYEGNVLVGSNLFDYGLGSDLKVVATRSRVGVRYL